MKQSVILWGPLRVAVIATAIVALAYIAIAAAVAWGVMQVGYQSVDAQLRDGMNGVKQTCTSANAGSRCFISQKSGFSQLIAWQVAPDGSLDPTVPGLPRLSAQKVPLDQPFTRPGTEKNWSSNTIIIPRIAIPDAANPV